jgi:hypothetical protein
VEGALSRLCLGRPAPSCVWRTGGSSAPCIRFGRSASGWDRPNMFCRASEDESIGCAVVLVFLSFGAATGVSLWALRVSGSSNIGGPARGFGVSAGEPPWWALRGFSPGCSTRRLPDAIPRRRRQAWWGYERRPGGFARSAGGLRPLREAYRGDRAGSQRLRAGQVGTAPGDFEARRCTDSAPDTSRFMSRSMNRGFFENRRSA